MLNASGGFVLFGVADHGAIRGQQVTTDTLEGVVRELRRIEPHAYLAPETIELGNGRAVESAEYHRIPRNGLGKPWDGSEYLGAARDPQNWRGASEIVGGDGGWAW